MKPRVYEGIYTLVIVGFLTFAPSPSLAQFGAAAEVQGTSISGTEDDPTAAATRLEREQVDAALGTTAELVEHAPGVRIRRLGPQGSFEGLSIRGASLRHTRVVLDDIPLENGDGSAVDLSLFPLSLLSRAELYRGGAPLALGGSAPGGTLRLLVDRRGQTGLEASTGIGSWGERQLRLTGSANSPSRPYRILATAGGRTSQNDFLFLDDRGTTLDASDDVERTRLNGQLTESWAMGSADLDLTGGSLRALLWTHQRTGGSPGAAAREPVFTRRHQGDYLAGLSWRQSFLTPDSEASPRLETRAALSLGAQERRFYDPYGEISLIPRDAQDWMSFAYGHAGLRWRGPASLRVDLQAHGRWSRLIPQDSLAAASSPNSQRRELGLGAEVSLRRRAAGWNAEVRLTGQLQHYLSSLANSGDSLRSRELAPNVRGGFSFEYRGRWSLNGSVGTAARVPTLLELFGDRAYLQGDTGLRPERGLSADAGIGFRHRLSGQNQVRLEVRGFHSRLRDLISYVRTAQLRLVPQNTGQARLLGGELDVNLRLFGVTASATYTYLDSVDEALGLDLPLRPRTVAAAHLAYEFSAVDSMGPIRIGVDANYLSSNFVDPANLVEIPSRLLLHTTLTIGLLADVLQLRLSVRDILDERAFDYVGFPMPGRSFAAEMTWSAFSR